MTTERRRGRPGRATLAIVVALAAAAVLGLAIVYRATTPTPSGTGVQRVAEGDVLRVGALPVT